MTAPFRIDLRDVSTFPTRRDEDWHYSDFRRAAPHPAPAAPKLAPPAPGGPFAGIAGDEIVFANGVTLEGADTARLYSDGGVLRLRFVTIALNCGWQAGFVLTVKAGAHLVLLESYEGVGLAYVSTVSLKIVLEPGASVERIVICEEPSDAVTVCQCHVELAADARFSQTVVLTGAKLQRHETHVRHPGSAVAVRMDGLYLLSGSRHSDLTTSILHAGLNGQSVQMIKGIATDTARGVFQGRIIVAPGADKTDARMRHDALLLSDHAEIDAKPALEIAADDVQCVHGNTVGALDPEAIFYARSRGVPEHQAKMVLIKAFVGEVCARIAHAPARDVVTHFVEHRLERMA